MEIDTDEVLLFVLHRTQVNSPGGLTRDKLPYTPQIDRLREQFYRQTEAGLSPHNFWKSSRWC